MSVSAGRHELIDDLLLRAAKLLDEESAALRSCRVCDHSEFVARKNMIAFQLEALSREGAGGMPANRLLRERVDALRRSLQENQAALEVHISVMREITRIIADVVEAAESDGTYTAEQARRGRRA